MKNKIASVRTLSLALAVLLLMAVPAASLAETVTVRIPSKLGTVSTPDIPDPLSLYTWTDSVAMGDPCPFLAVEDAIMHLQFSQTPDFAVANWYGGKENIDVGADGYAELTTEGRVVQAGFTWDGVTKENEWFIQAGKDGVTAGYTNSGKVRFIEYTVDYDFFETGVEGAKTTFRFEPVTIDGDHYVYEYDQATGKTKKVNKKGTDVDGDGLVDHWYYTSWYIPTITTVYPAGSGLTKIVANYWNNKKGTIKKFAVSYSPSGTYSCTSRVQVTQKPFDTVPSYGRTIQVNSGMTIRVSGY